MEPDNTDRAEWAGAALDKYAEMTRNDPREQTVTVDGPDDEEGREHAEEVLSDLLCDLQHLADQLGVDWDVVTERGERNHADEMEESDD